MLPVRGPVGTSGRYILGERLEGGGVSEVYRAEPVDAQFDDPIVLKRMPAALAGVPDFIAMFVDEARQAMRLDHPHIAKVHDFVASDEGVFLVMEMVDGPDLQTILGHYAKQGRALPAEVAAYIASQALDALDYAHRLTSSDGAPLGVVHRGIAPDTIALTRRGQVKLMDFGVARLMALGRTSDPALPKRDLGYLSAEQIRGEPIDGRCDVWSMGIVLAEMLMGTRLFSADDDVELLLMVRRGDLSRLDAHGDHIPRPLEAIVRKALARDAEERYQSAADLADALAQYLFSRKMKVTSRDIQALVRDTQLEQMRKRSAEPKESLIDTLINDEIGKMTSLVDGQSDSSQTAEGSMSLDPGAFVDTSNWSGELASQQQHKRPTRPPPLQPNGKRGIHTPPPGDIASLEQMLEGGDRTGLHGKAEKKTNWVLVIIVMLVLAGGAAAAVVMLMT